MAMKKLSAFATALAANAANVAGQTGGALDTDNITGLANMLTVLAGRKDLLLPLLQACTKTGIPLTSAPRQIQPE